MTPCLPWTTRGDRRRTLTEPMIMGVVNCTPDSFYDGGRLRTVHDVAEHGLKLAREGAHILDLGGESTRPGARPVAEAEELERVLPALTELAREREERCLKFLLSVDTAKSAVASASLEAGADIVNDISACRFDPGLRDVLVQHQPGYVLMHSLGRPETMQRQPHYDNVVDEVLAFFQERMDQLVSAGFKEERIILDPGIGFGKLLEHNIALLRAVDRFAAMGRPVLVGLSNKSLWQDLLGLDLADRGPITQVATALLAVRGAAVHRVHDVKGAVQALRVVKALRPWGGAEGPRGNSPLATPCMR